MRRYSKYIWALFLSTIVSCQEQITTVQDESQSIVFKSFLKEGSQVTPLTRVLGTDLTEGYMLGGAITTGSYLTSDKTHFYTASDREMLVTGQPKDPNAPKLYWNTDGKSFHTFYAYTANPAETPAGFGVIGVRKFTSNTAAPQGVCVLFKQHNDPAKQVDLLVADNSNIVVSPGVTSAVNLYFQHRLSKVSIKVFGTGGANLTNCQARVIYGATAPYSGVGSASVDGVFAVRNNKGEYELTPTNRLQAPRHSGTYNLGPVFTISNTQANELDASLAGSMIFIPQTLTTEAWATIELEYSVDGAPNRYKATLDMPAITQLYPTKEYIFALNLIERSSILTVKDVRLVDWNTQNEVIDNLPGEYSLSLSTNRPTDLHIPTAGKSYDINVTCSRGWTISKREGVTATPSSGKKGTTKVTIKVDPLTTGVDRNVYSVFNTVGAVESMVSATWMGIQAAPISELFGTLIWARGNLIANGKNGCKIGSPDDTGVYFQFGSLIGWKGGASGDGKGRKALMDGDYYAGTTFNAVDEVSVVPREFTRIANIGTTWPVNKTNLYYFGLETYSNNNLLRDFQGFADGSLAVNGVGDPCRYYLGDTWRLPNLQEVKDMAWLVNSNITTVGESKEGSTIYKALVSPKTNAAQKLEFTCVGIRKENGSMLHNGKTYFFMTDETYSLADLYTSWNFFIGMLPWGADPRSIATPVRCVMDKLI